MLRVIAKIIGVAGVSLISTLAPSLAQAEDITSFTLENGMDVVLIEDHRAPAVTHMVWYKVGAADEPLGKSGIAHYLEHLMFKGTDTVGPGEFSRRVSAEGGSDNAFTSWDYTGYFQRVAADRLPLVMEMEADRMTGLKLTEELARPELGVVLEERNERTDSSPGALFGEQRRAAQYLHHPYGRPIIGWRHEIESLTMQDAMDFYSDHYAPNNATLVVAGDVSPDELRALAEQYYGTIPANPAITDRARVQEPPQLAERRVVFEDPRITNPYVMRSYLAPERDAGDQKASAALELLADYLGDDPATSYLGRKLLYENPVGLYAAAYYRGTSLDDTLFTVMMSPNPDLSLAEAEAALDGAIASFFEDGIDEDRLASLKRQRKAAEIYRQDNIDGLARYYGEALTSGLTLADIEAWPEIVQAVTSDDIMAAARDVFDRKRAVTGWLSAPSSPDSSASQTQEVSQ